jgi:hypothetical protein
MAEVKNKKLASAPAEGDYELYRVRYDFDEDAGAVGALDLLEMDGAAVLTEFYAVVPTACSSAGAMTLDVGVKGGDTDLLLDDVAVASLTADSLHQPAVVEGTPNVLPMPVRLADASFLQMEIKTAALDAGQIDFIFVLRKA